MRQSPHWLVACALAALLPVACGGMSESAPPLEEPPQTIVFLGSAPEYLQDQVFFEAALAADFLADRFGVNLPDVVTYAGMTREEVAAAYREETRLPLPPGLECLATNCMTAEVSSSLTSLPAATGSTRCGVNR